MMDLLLILRGYYKKTVLFQEHQDGVNRAVAELVEHYKKLKIPTVHPKYLAPLQLV